MHNPPEALFQDILYSHWRDIARHDWYTPVTQIVPPIFERMSTVLMALFSSEDVNCAYLTRMRAKYLKLGGSPSTLADLVVEGKNSLTSKGEQFIL